ncbi:MAG TPA: acyl-CoA dehydrogenase family protein [Polyangiaceae bacterium]
MTEQSFMKALFFGVIAEDVVFPYPELGESEKVSLHGLLERVRKFLEQAVKASEIDGQGSIPTAVLDGMRELGLFGLAIPTEYGGQGLSTTAYARVIQEVASVDASLGLVLHVHQAVAARGLLMFGSDEQKRRWLPELARGERLAAFALTEQAAGSDAGSIRTLAVLDDEQGVYRLNGSKPWVTNGELADLFIVFARTNPADEGSKPRITALVVERGRGVETRERHETLGVRGAGVAHLAFDDVVVPKANVVGEPGKGFKIAMSVLNDARLGIAAALVGQCRALINLSVLRLRKRRSFGRVLGEYPILKDKVSRMVCDTYAIESMTYLTTGLSDRGVEDYSLESAIGRVAATEALWRVVNEAMQLGAGPGYVKGHPLERHLRDARIAFVIDGTNEVLRCFIALAGLRGPGQRLSDVQSAMYEPIKGFGLLREFAVRKVREALRRDRITQAHPLLARETVMFEEIADELGRACDRALREHGSEIAEMQYPQMRIANVAIDLYALLACISRTSRVIEQSGEGGARRHLDLTAMFATTAQARMLSNLQQLEHNDDELRKAVASRIYTDGGYPFDIL